MMHELILTSQPRTKPFEDPVVRSTRTGITLAQGNPAKRPVYAAEFTRILVAAALAIGVQLFDLETDPAMVQRR